MYAFKSYAPYILYLCNLSRRPPTFSGRQGRRRTRGCGFSGFTHLQLQGGRTTFQHTGQVQILPLYSQGHRDLVVACFPLHVAHGEDHCRKESKLGQGYSPAGRTQAPDLTKSIQSSVGTQKELPWVQTGLAGLRIDSSKVRRLLQAFLKTS